MSWLPRPTFLAAPSRESGSNSAGYRASEGLGFRRTEQGVAAVAAVRGMARWRLAWRVDRAIDLAAWRTAKGPMPLH